jgi:hypothetical protein
LCVIAGRKLLKGEKMVEIQIQQDAITIKGLPEEALEKIKKGGELRSFSTTEKKFQSNRNYDYKLIHKHFLINDQIRILLQSEESYPFSWPN